MSGRGGGRGMGRDGGGGGRGGGRDGGGGRGRGRDGGGGGRGGRDGGGRGGRDGGGGGRGRGYGGRGEGSAAPPAAHFDAGPVLPPPPRRALPATTAAVAAIGRQMETGLVVGEAGAGPPPASSKAQRFPLRTEYGKVGEKCIVRANHFLVKVADLDLHHYDVAITPEVTNRGVCRAVISELVKLHRESALGRRLPAYDGRKSLYTAGALPFEAKEFAIKLNDKDRGERDFKVAIKLAGKADVHHLKQFLAGAQLESPQETIQVLDVVLRESPSTAYTMVGRSFFSPLFGHQKDIGDGLECWRGYYQSIRPTQMGLSLNIDISNTSFYKPVPVLEFASEYLNLRDMGRPLSDADRIKLKKALRGLRVEVTHRGDCKRRYRITGISLTPVSQLRFPADDKGTLIYVAQYFKEKYNYTLRYLSLPCLQAGSDSKPTFLPMEVCKIVEGQRFSKKLNERQVTEILRSACERPQLREKSILEMVHQNNYNKDKHVQEFGMNIATQLTAVEARVLPAPKLKYHDSGKEKSCVPRVGQWNMISKRMVNGGTLENWACISFAQIHQDQVFNFCHQLFGQCTNIGMTVNTNPLINFCFDRPENIEAALRNVYTQSSKRLAAQGMTGKSLQLLVVILPQRSGFYGKIKRICETDLDIVSQCCQPKHVVKGNIQYLENLALKINVKVGGRNTVLEDAVHYRIPLVTDKPTIVFGADVTHPPPGEDASASIAAVVASMDWPEVTKYRGLVSAQTHREEMIEDLFSSSQDPQKGGIVYGGMIRELLIAFRRSTGHKPSRIIFYRDGVSEGQFSHVLLHEIDAIRRACASLEEGFLPPITFVVVQKRHHTRLFPDVRNPNLTDRSGNIVPGTVVDTQICHPTEFDFYLCSHAGIQGTSRPTHYHVLFDENQFTPDLLQLLTNNLCYTYARCTRSVSVVPPAYYAHLAAFRARYYVEGEYSDGGSTSAGGNTRGRSAEVRPLPKIKDKVKAVMFYC